MTELAAESVSTPEELAADEDAAADTDFAEDVDEALEIASRSLPVLGQGREVRLVVEGHVSEDPSNRSPSSSATAIWDQPRFGARSRVPVRDLDEPWNRDGAADGDSAHRRSISSRAPPGERERAESSTGARRLERAVVAVHPAAHGGPSPVRSSTHTAR